jgi:Ser/Thr protein kinase RdoA (MazF antagonist)
VLREAGRDLALINSVAVEGFGWVRRDRSDQATLSADLPSLRAFAFDGLAADLAALAPYLDASVNSAIEWVVDDLDRLLDQETATLAHGDFDRSHIFVDGGAFGGIIDFGEIRGTDRFYDLGHFALHAGGGGPDALRHLLASYAEVSPLPPDAMARIRLWSLLIGVRRLAIIRDRPAEAYRRTLLAGVRHALTELQNG